MEIYITEQARVFLFSVFLGFALGALYDMVGALRGKWKALTPVLDVGYGFCLLGSVFLFTLRQSQGQLRLFVLMGMLGGGVLFFTGLSMWLRPVWGFWIDSLVWLGQILALPMVISGKLVKIFRNYIKKLFYFWHKYCTINYHIQGYSHKGGANNGKSKKNKKAKS